MNRNFTLGMVLVLLWALIFLTGIASGIVDLIIVLSDSGVATYIIDTLFIISFTGMGFGLGGIMLVLGIYFTAD